MRNQLTMTLAVTALAMNAVACSLEVEQIMAVQPGSGIAISTTSPFASGALQPLEGGSVMNIDIQIGLFDLILGDFEGDIEVDEVLIAAPGFRMLNLLPTGRICVVPNAEDPGGGIFEANIYSQEATFDVALNTEAIFGSATITNLLGALPFPFALVSTIPFDLSDMLGMLTGSSDITITQAISQPIDVTTMGSPPFGGLHILGSITGEITLASADAFPTSPVLDECIAILAQ
jgi:hypothetical protein